jgi:hypothetical protein
MIMHCVQMQIINAPGNPGRNRVIFPFSETQGHAKRREEYNKNYMCDNVTEYFVVDDSDNFRETTLKGRFVIYGTLNQLFFHILLEVKKIDFS